MGTTGVLIIHNDASLLAQTLESAKPYIDDLVVVDGAYEWVAPFCELEGENPERSTDNLKEVLDASGIPYRYFSGVWKNETHKRLESLQFANNEKMMLIDSDEIYDVPSAALEDFWASDQVLGNLSAPLYMHDDIVTQSNLTGELPVKPVFIARREYDLEQIVKSLWLLLPESEKGQGIPNNRRNSDPFGLLHHLSLFRTDGNPYRRARFYNLLSMRVAGEVRLPGGGAFANDTEFAEIVGGIDREALNMSFHFHRLATAFGNIKPNQWLVRSPKSSSMHRNVIEAAYQGMLEDQEARVRKLAGRTLRVFNGRPMFFDITLMLRSGISRLEIHSMKEVVTNVAVHYDHGVERFTENVGHLNFDTLNRIQSNSRYAGARRTIIEVVPRGDSEILEINFDI